RDYINSHQMLATGPESVRMIYDWLFEPESLARPEFDLDHYVALWDLTNRQDARNCEWQQEGLHARPLAHGTFVPQEHGCHQFNQWVLDCLGEGKGPRGSQSGTGSGMSGRAQAGHGRGLAGVASAAARDALALPAQERPLRSRS